MAWMLDGKTTLRKEEAGFLLQEACWYMVGCGAHPFSQVAAPSMLFTFQDCPELTSVDCSWRRARSVPPLLYTYWSDHFTPCVCCSCGSRLLLSRDMAGAQVIPEPSYIAAESKSNQPDRLICEHSPREAITPSRRGTFFFSASSELTDMVGPSLLP